MKRYLILIIILVNTVSLDLYALAPSSGTKYSDFKARWLEAARLVRTGKLDLASMKTGLDEECLDWMSVLVGNSLGDEVPPFQTPRPTEVEVTREGRLNDYLERCFRYPLLDEGEKKRLKEHLLSKMGYLLEFLDRKLNKTAGGISKESSYQLAKDDIKGIFVFGSWLWEGFIAGAKPATDIDLYFIVSDTARIPWSIDVSRELGELDNKSLHVSIIPEDDFIYGRLPEKFFKKMIIYTGLQIEGYLYFAGKKAKISQIFAFLDTGVSNVEVLLKGNRPDVGAVKLIREIEVILNYVRHLYSLEKTDLAWLIARVQPGMTVDQQTRVMNEFRDVVYRVERAVLDNMLAEKIVEEITSSL